MRDHTYFSNRISGQAEILQGSTGHMKLYCGKFSGHIEFENILFQMIEVTRQILRNLSN